MNYKMLQDRLHLGLGLAARQIGQSTDLFRPNGPFDPLGTSNRILRLTASFMPAKGNDGRTNVYGEALWYGIFDASYTRTGDYLDMGGTLFFVASQEPLLPILCVRCNRVTSVARPSVQSNAADNSYGGYTSGGSTTVIEGWPASVLSENRSGTSAADLPTDQTVPYWNILLPAAQGVVFSPGDFVTDDLFRTAVIVSSELTSLGWRMSAKMAVT
jgi:hypothetical protein